MSQNIMLPTEKRAALTLAGIYALRMLGMFLVLPVLSLHAATLPGAHDNKFLLGLAFGIYGLTQALLQLPLGLASDKFGRKKVIYLGLIVFAIGSFMAAFAGSLTMLVIARAIQGAGAVSAAVSALLADLTREEVRTRAMAMIGLSIGLVFSFSLVAAPFLNHLIGVPGIFMLTGVLTLIAMLVVKLVVPNPTRFRLHEDMRVTGSHLLDVLKNPQLLRLNFGIFSLHAAQMALFIVLPFMLINLGLAKVNHWHIYLPAVIVGLVLMLPAIIFGETKGRLKTVYVGGIVAVALAQLGLSLDANSTGVILLLMMLYFVGFNLLEASLPSMISKIAPVGVKGTAMGVYNTAQSLGLFTGGALGGLIFQHAGSRGVLIFGTALLVVWLLVALSAPAPKSVKSALFAVGDFWNGQEDVLLRELLALPFVEGAMLSTDKKTVFMKVLQQGFDGDWVEEFITRRADYDSQ